MPLQILHTTAETNKFYQHSILTLSLQNLRTFKLHKTTFIFTIFSIVLYLGFAYDLDRSNFLKLISLYTGLFIMAYFLIEKYGVNFKVLAGLGIVFRLIFIFSTPNLSQDFYRFIWDGRLMAQGISPYIFTPNLSTVHQVTVEQSEELIGGMKSLSASNFSNYPPINQFFFAIAALFAGKSILGSAIVLRIIIILADIGILYLGKKLLDKLNLPIKNIFWYFLNPFILIELTGNLHFEGVMLFFFIWGMYLFFNNKWFWASVLIGISVSVKLLPLLFLPLFIEYLTNQKKTSSVLKTCEVSIKKILGFYSIIGVTIILSFLPFLSLEFFQNFSSTTALWFQRFEFNASIYYIIRWLGFQIIGWNIIEIVGKILPILIFFFVLGLTLCKRNNIPLQLFTSMLFAVSFYFLLSTTVHPWYIATPLLLSIFTKYKFPIIWSFMIFLSYSAYGRLEFEENLWLVALEYLVVIGVAARELISQKRSLRQDNLYKTI